MAEEIAESILETGQQPVRIRPDEDRFVVVEGLHRLEACKALGEKTILGILVSSEVADQKTRLTPSSEAEAERQKMVRLRKLRIEKEAADKLAVASRAVPETESAAPLREHPEKYIRNDSKPTRSKLDRTPERSMAAKSNGILVAIRHVMTGGTGADNFAFLQTGDGAGIIAGFNNFVRERSYRHLRNRFLRRADRGQGDASAYSKIRRRSGLGLGALIPLRSRQCCISARCTQASTITVATVQAGVTINPHDLCVRPGFRAAARASKPTTAPDSDVRGRVRRAQLNRANREGKMSCANGLQLMPKS